MKVRIKSPCIVNGQHRETGDLVEVDDSTGRQLYAAGRVDLADIRGNPEIILTKPETIEHRDPQPAGRTRKARQN